MNHLFYITVKKKCYNKSQSFISANRINNIATLKPEKKKKNLIKVEYYTFYKKEHYVNKLQKKSLKTSFNFNKLYYIGFSKYKDFVYYKQFPI